jgi:glutaredoxin 3
MSRIRKELKSSAPMSIEVKMYTTRFCPYCVRARSLLANKDVEFIDVAVDSEPDLRREMVELSGRYTVPQIWIGSKHIGGYDDIALLERKGQLDQMLQAA